MPLALPTTTVTSSLHDAQRLGVVHSAMTHGNDAISFGAQHVDAFSIADADVAAECHVDVAL